MYGVAVTSAIVQTTLSVRLPDALGEIPDKWRVRPFSLLCAVLCRFEAGNKRDTYTTTRYRLLTRSGTRCPPSRRSRRMCSSKHGSFTTTGYGTRLRRRRLSLPLRCVLPFSPEHRDFVARNRLPIDGESASDSWRNKGEVWDSKVIDTDGHPGRVSDERTSSYICLGSKLKIKRLCFLPRSC